MRALWAGTAVFLCGSLSAAAEEVELHFEMKLLLRDRVMFRRVAVDQWAGGVLRMARRPAGGGSSRYTLSAVIEDPWTFRWYPTKDEAKLGAAVAVEQPTGHPYGSLEPLLLPLAREKHRLWWADDRVEATAARSPPWSDDADSFWAERHRAEEQEKDPLHPDAVYPFHVLGDVAGRVVFAVRPDGAVDLESIRETASRPWLERGWQEWIAGRGRAGYGYWEERRPDWEPRTYETLAAALRLLAWSPVPFDTAAEELEGRLYDEPGLVGATARVVETLAPRARGRLPWVGELRFRCRAVDSPHGPAMVCEARKLLDSDDDPGEIRYWRYVRPAANGDGIEQDELQLLARANDGNFKLWIRIGYRPVD